MIDGRFRIRISKNENETISKLSWKRRLKDTTKGNVNCEEEIEVYIDNYEKFIYIVEQVMHFKLIETIFFTYMVILNCFFICSWFLF